MPNCDLSRAERLERLGFAGIVGNVPSGRKFPDDAKEWRDTAEGLKVLGMLAEVNIVMRNDHQDAMGTGQGVTELNPTGAAADEMRRLWAWVDNRTKGLPRVKAA